jgi:hypothetical protein
MINPISIAIKLAGIVAAGAALGAGWHLGTYLGDVALGEKTIDWPSLETLFGARDAEEPLWKRKFGPISEG